MSVLTAAQAAIARLVGRRPAAVVSSQEPMDVEVVALAQEAAVDIMKAHDWQALTKLAIISGTGATQYDLPTDYDRMVVGMGVTSPSWPDWRFTQARSLDEWALIETRDFNLEPGWWMLLGGKFQTLPVLGSGDEARFYYISRDIFIAANGSPKAAIDQDSDNFFLGDRLLTLGIVWRWNQLKKMDYAEDLRLYEDALSQEMARDKGPQVIRHNGRARFHGASLAWPWELGPL